MGLLDFSPALMSASAATLAVIYMYLYKLKPKKPLNPSYDYIVIGAGSAGCVVAARLSEDPTKTVLLLEAGQEADDHRISVPDASPTLQQSDVDWNYQVLGGCSSVNAMIYMRGHKADYDSWEKLGAVGWGWDDVLPYFLKSENNTIPNQVSSPYHGAGGPLTVTERPYTCDMSLQFV
ncbi:alcohol dehydrogenase [acceptor]-like [Amphiura filiformis]|uniref:alcohol dehydrogenase [acceptor]-like n=1 Tax=Amphiura filiformis TaxID=82378 RepID=UPI003B210AC0